MKRFEDSLSKVESNHPLHRVIISCLKEDEGECPTAAALAFQLSDMKTTQEYMDSLSSKQESEKMREQIDKLTREKNQATIEFKTQQQKMKLKLKRQKSSTKALEGAKNEAEATLSTLEEEYQQMTEKYQEEKDLRRRDIENISKTAEMGLLAMNFAYQTERLDCKMAKEKAQYLSDEKKATNEKMMADKEKITEISGEREKMAEEIEKLREMTRSQARKLEEKERDLEEKKEEKDKTIHELRKQRISCDELIAKLVDQAQKRGVDLQLDLPDY